MLQLQNISKSFSGVQALKNISIEFEQGSVHAICGENGAGKSTLMNIISGNLQPDEGAIIWKKQGVAIDSIAKAQQMGIGIVHQERSLVDSLTVAENIFPVNAPKNRWGLIDFKKLFRQTEELLATLQLKNIAPRTLVAKLSTAQKQMVEIAKALASSPSLLILDEPTASITLTEIETLFQLVQKLKTEGVAVIYISHRMAEIKEVADTVSVLKDGRHQGSFDAKQIPLPKLLQLMVGRELLQQSYISYAEDEVVLKLENLSGKGFRNINLSLRKGEVLGLAGLLGSGRTELALSLFGELKITDGKVFRDGKKIKLGNTGEAIQNGIAYVPDERKSLGLFLEKTVADNIASTQLKSGFYRENVIRRMSEKLKSQFDIRTPSIKQLVRKLSGGNQQKIVLAKWLLTDPEILLVNEPTHGVDVGAKAEIYKLFNDLTEKGKSILLISSELPELLLLSDRIAVLYNGELKGILPRSDATEEKIAAMASGL
jgi:ABC-type sugar transport system ATPase subunit